MRWLKNSVHTQLCDLSNNNAWDTEKAVIVGLGNGSGGSGALDAMVGPDGNDAPGLLILIWKHGKIF